MRPLNLEPCQPSVWNRGGHTQTILGHLLPSPRLASPGEPIAIALDDARDGGDQLIGAHHPGTSGTVVYLFHGLGGSSGADYMHRTAQVSLGQGHTTILFNHRGCGEGAGKAQGIYHSGRGEDLGRAIAWGRARYPSHRHLAIGFSLSGNALLLLSTGRRGSPLPDAAISVNAPIDLERCSKRLVRGLNRIYDARFVRLLRRDIESRRHSGLLPADAAAIPWYATLREFDSLYTAPRAGFATREDYYRECSTVRHLSELKIPTVLITAADDPFVDVEDYRSLRLPAHAHLHIEACGGHMGYLSGRKTPLGSHRWLDYALGEYLKQF